MEKTNMANWGGASQFATLKGMQISALQNGTGDEDLVAGNLTTLTQMATSGSTYAAAQAQEMLNSVNGLAYLPEITLPSAGQQGLLAPPVGQPVTLQPNQVTAVPNPAQQTTVFHYELEEAAGPARLVVRSMEGRVVLQEALLEKKGTLAWDFGHVADGIYFFGIEVDGKMASTFKLVIFR